MPNRRDAEAPRSPVIDRAAAAGVVLAVVVSWFAVDPRSVDAFDAPKLLLCGFALAWAAAATFLARLGRSDALRPPPPGTARIVAGLAAAGAAAVILSAAASARPAVSIGHLRTAALLLLALPVGASRAVRRHRRGITGVYLVSAGASAVLVLLALLGVWTPVAVIGSFRRVGLGALIGNAGHLGISLAIAVAPAAALALEGKGRARAAGSALLALLLAGVVATQTLTAVVVALAAALSAVLLRSRKLAAPTLGAVAVCLAAATLALPPLRFRAKQTIRAVQERDWNRVLTARAAPWLAATEMIRRHPAFGVGPGRFHAEFIPARLDAERRYHRRLVLRGFVSNSFSRAHNDYLDSAASAGLPAAALLVAAYFLLVARLVRKAARRETSCGPPAALIAGGVGALAWFPFQVPASLLWLLVSAGIGYRDLRGEP